VGCGDVDVVGVGVIVGVGVGEGFFGVGGRREEEYVLVFCFAEVVGVR
jgi:hypothetical protein